MTARFYTQEELDVAIAKERLWIAEMLLRRAKDERLTEAAESLRGASIAAGIAAACEAYAKMIIEGRHPRPLTIADAP